MPSPKHAGNTTPWFSKLDSVHCYTNIKLGYFFWWQQRVNIQLWSWLENWSELEQTKQVRTKLTKQAQDTTLGSLLHIAGLDCHTESDKTEDLVPFTFYWKYTKNCHFFFIFLVVGMTIFSGVSFTSWMDRCWQVLTKHVNQTVLLLSLMAPVWLF